MTKVIIHENETGGVVVLMPAPDCGLTLEQIALKDVPPEKPFKYVEKSQLPKDDEFFEAWEVDMSSPDGVGADYGFGSTNDVIAWNEDGTPVIRKATV